MKKFFAKKPVPQVPVVEVPEFRYYIARQEGISGRMVSAVDEFGYFDSPEEAFSVARQDRIESRKYRGLQVGREYADGRLYPFAGYAMGNLDMGLRFSSVYA
jgi:hypothetical protein